MKPILILALAFIIIGSDIPLSCASHSMIPAFDCHAKLTAIRTDTKNLSIGDIIVFGYTPDMRLDESTKHNGISFIIHRIVDVQKSIVTNCKHGVCWTTNKINYITKGDDNNYIDPWLVPYHNVYWKVVL